jgi:glutamate synthase domain-containing protein 1/glutamate synthase domain-containing protein 3
MKMIENILNSRKKFLKDIPLLPPVKGEEEGGCGVTGFACTIPVRGKHIFEPSIQMHNRGNGKGGGIAAVGLSAEQLGVSQEILEQDYLLQIALLDPEAQPEVEYACIIPFLDVHKAEKVQTVGDFRDIEGLEVKPPDVWRYFARVKPDVLENFIKKNHLQSLDARKAEDEFIYQNTFRLNQKFYASLGEKRAFVLSHGRNMLIFKIVGYAENIVRYYQLENLLAYMWIAHQRYPTRGRVWHPGGAHPFIGLNEALVHNGDFANYYSVTEYLQQRNIYPLFLTDTEASSLLFDLLSRVYEYPLEYIIEALAPTTERDFDLLPPEKQKIYQLIQSSHIHGSPDGPWFFIIARNDPYKQCFQLLGITDTSMLRPQVFALFENEDVQIGLICSEKQAIDATLHSLAAEDKRFSPIADKYWNARGGSHTDGGAFIFSLENVNGRNGVKKLICTDKFGSVVSIPQNQKYCDMTIEISQEELGFRISDFGIIPLISFDQTFLFKRKVCIPNSQFRIPNSGTGQPSELFGNLRDNIASWDYNTFRWFLNELKELAAENDEYKDTIIEALTLLNDLRYDTGDKKRSSILRIIREALHDIFAATPSLEFGIRDYEYRYRFINWKTRKSLRAPSNGEKILIINAEGFPPEGDFCDARLICEAYDMGWKRFIAYGYKGQRFCGCGFGPDTKGVRIDVYDSSGDYLASGIDGLEIYVHGNGQDQLGQIMKAGKLVVFGDVGQTFMYGAKGGEVYIMGNAAGRPLINAVGKPRVVINGTCLDYLAESFMAGEPLEGGGFVVLNGIYFDDEGKGSKMARWQDGKEARWQEQPAPYPGSNLFSLASGGAIYVRDPHQHLVDEQLNGGEFAKMTAEDWELILPYLKENERLFGISIEDDLLTVDGVKKAPEEVYRKVRAIKLAVLTAGESE